MATPNNYLYAALIVLVIVLVYVSTREGRATFEPTEGHPYAFVRRRLDAQRGHDVQLDSPGAVGRFVKVDTVTPERIAEAERESWFAALEKGQVASVDPERMTEPTAYHDKEPEIDYATRLTSIIADDRMVQNHRAWAKDMKPWSGVARKVGEIEVENYLHFQGLRRPQAVAQHAPLQLTEIDQDDLVKNKKFRFVA